MRFFARKQMHNTKSKTTALQNRKLFRTWRGINSMVLSKLPSGYRQSRKYKTMEDLSRKWWEKYTRRKTKRPGAKSKSIEKNTKLWGIEMTSHFRPFKIKILKMLFNRKLN